MQLAVKVEDIPEYVFRLKGVPEKLLRSDKEKKDLTEQAAAVLQQQRQQEQTAAQGGVEAPEVGQ
jgi:hypothetical protein